jgi:hypothetical protein
MKDANMSEESEIGNPGDSVNLSVASRAARLAPDLERLKKYDEYPAKTRKQKLRHLFWALLFGAPTALLIAKGYPWWSIVPGLFAVWNLFCFVIYRNASPEAVYENGLLCAAIIVNEDPLQIAVLAEMQTDEDAPTCWGVKRFDVKELPLHTLQKHERVPCAVMFGGVMPFAGLWSEIEPHPLCWASGDAALLEEAKNAITEAEWCTLEGLSVCAEKRQDIDFSKEIAYFNADFSPRIDLQEKPEASNEETHP